MFYPNDIHTWLLEFLSIVFCFLSAATAASMEALAAASMASAMPYTVRVHVVCTNGTQNYYIVDRAWRLGRREPSARLSKILCDILLQLRYTFDVHNYYIHTAYTHHTHAHNVLCQPARERKRVNVCWCCVRLCIDVNAFHLSW